MLVDCDIHVGYETLADLIPYLDAPTAELVRQSGTNGLAMPTLPVEPPVRLDPPRPLRARRGTRRELRLHVARDAAGAPPRPVRDRPRHPRAGRGRRLLRPSELPARGPPLHRVQRLAARQLAPPGAAAARDDRRAGPVAGGGGPRDQAARQPGRVRRRLPPGSGPGAVRQPDVRPDLGGGRRARAPGGRPHPLRVDRHRRPDHRGGDARLLRRVPHPLRLRDVRALRVDPLPRDLRALPRDPRRDGRGRARSVRGLPLAPGHELEGRAAPRSRGAAAGRPSTSGTTSASPPSRSRRPTTPGSCCGRSSSCVPRRR